MGHVINWLFFYIVGHLFCPIPIVDFSTLSSVSVLSYSYCSQPISTYTWLSNPFQNKNAYFDYSSVNFSAPFSPLYCHLIFRGHNFTLAFMGTVLNLSNWSSSITDTNRESNRRASIWHKFKTAQTYYVICPMMETTDSYLYDCDHASLILQTVQENMHGNHTRGLHGSWKPIWKDLLMVWRAATSIQLVRGARGERVPRESKLVKSEVQILTFG